MLLIKTSCCTLQLNFEMSLLKALLYVKPYSLWVFFPDCDLTSI